jgi:hypothetical protein
MGPMNDFNLQDYLRDMRDEQREYLTDMRGEQNKKIDDLSTDVKAALETQGDHTTRITLLERSRVNFVKGGWLVFGAILVFVLDLIRDHWLAANTIASLKP